MITVSTLLLTTFAHAAPVIDAYRVLGVDANVSQNDLRQAWRNLTKTHMPLVNRGDEDALEKMKLINQAYNLVKTSRARAKYAANAARPEPNCGSNADDTFKETNRDEVLARHPEWSSILSDYDSGVADILVNKDWSTLLQIYEAMWDEDFVRACVRGLAKLDDSPGLRRTLTKIIEIESSNHPPHPRVWNLGTISRYVFSQPRFLALTTALLPKFFRAAHRYDHRVVMRDVFAHSFSLPLGDAYLWEIVRRTRNEDDKATLHMMAEWVFRDGATGSRRDPELLVALVQEEGRQIMASRILAWRYLPEWGQRGLQAIVDKADSDALTGLRRRLATPEFAGSEWDVYRDALTHADHEAGPALAEKVGTLILREPAPSRPDCNDLFVGETPPQAASSYFEFS